MELMITKYTVGSQDSQGGLCTSGIGSEFRVSFGEIR